MSDFPDFPTFFRHIWGYDPFPWQVRLAETTVREDWPEWITLPTGTGKTAAIDIAVYNLARQAARPPGERTAPVRIVFAVNRRIVVDEAFERAKTIATTLKEALGDSAHALHPVASVLQRLSGIEHGDPLETYPLRGATFTDHSWACTPSQPLVITTTLDQLGSRLLFRGYGVSEFARPVQAALLANDALLILDEAHTARAFSQTLASIAAFRRRAAEPLQLPFHAVQLTATPPSGIGGRKPFALDDADQAHPVIHARLHAGKPTELVPVEDAKGAGRHKKLAEAMSEKAIDSLAHGHSRVLIVVNRVATAEALKAKLDPPRGDRGHGAAVHLLTGRLRPLDREALIKDLNGRHELKSVSPSPEVPPLILIATQCIEVGADYDFDALLTELAPLDSLRQRFGRLNRQGRDIAATATIFAPGESLDEGKADPLYGSCLPSVWEWLSSVEALDFGLAAMGTVIPHGEALDSLLAPAADAPVLLAPHLDLLCQTSPEPCLSPDPSLYIHGPGKNFPEVSVVLRADLGEAGDASKMLEAVPPLGVEAATVPLHHARTWLENPTKAADAGGDSPHNSLPDDWSRAPIAIALPAFRWRAGEATPLSSPNDLRPGDVLVLSAQTPTEQLNRLFPCSDAGPWTLDQFELAHLCSRDRLAIRFHEAIWKELEAALLDAEPKARFREIVSPLFAKEEEEARWLFCETDWLAAIPALAALLAEHLPDEHTQKRVWQFAANLSEKQPRPRSDWKAVRYPDGTCEGAMFLNRSRVGSTPWPFDPADLGRQGNFGNDPCPLDRHSADVSHRAESNARGLPPVLVQTLRDAGLWHDLGKLDPRFQALLHGCSPWAVPAKTLLAKSGRRINAREPVYRRISGLPDGFRHELLSALVVALSQAGKSYPERDLLLHLIASHHGRCRALAPVVPDPIPEPFDAEVIGETIRFDGQDCPLAHLSHGVARRFWTLTRRFGWWGLPYLEAMLRLADQYESANSGTSVSS
ncbi:MAG: type I-U CRISPR-associated helicase/endonuclease Cas3 [Verrucomicrobiaceae bacterium]|nr:type I-U CRISPR-associated helicase/endonuclease Cas3 [Verrucomicrobiaceae bacterium]